MEKTNDNTVPPFVQIEIYKAKQNGHDMGHVFLSNFQFISFSKNCDGPLFFDHEFDKHNLDTRRFVRGITGGKCLGRN